MRFSDSFRKMERHVEHKMGAGSGTDNPEVEVLFNGQPVGATMTPIELAQPFALGGYEDNPTCTVALAKVDFEAFGQPTLGKNRFVIAGEQLRVLKRGLDTISGDVSLFCGPVDN